MCLVGTIQPLLEPHSAAAATLLFTNLDSVDILPFGSPGMSNTGATYPLGLFETLHEDMRNVLVSHFTKMEVSGEFWLTIVTVMPPSFSSLTEPSQLSYKLATSFHQLILFCLFY